MIDEFFNRTYDKSNYHCGHFVCEAWQKLTGQVLSDTLKGFLCRRLERKAILSDLKRFRILKKPESPCIALFQSTRSQTHVGIWLNGKILHIGPAGVQYQPIDVVSISFSKIRFLKC